MKLSLFVVVFMLLVTLAFNVNAEVRIDKTSSVPVVSVVRQGKTIFEHRFKMPQEIHEAIESVSGQYLAIWHHDYPPRRLKIFRLTDGKMLADFVPGFGGNLMWTRGDKLLHSWGCGTNCQNVSVYDIAGGTLRNDTTTGHILTPDGYYLAFPTLLAVDQTIRKYDVNTNKETILYKDLPDIPQNIKIKKSTLVVQFIDHGELRISLDPTETKD